MPRVTRAACSFAALIALAASLTIAHAEEAATPASDDDAVEATEPAPLTEEQQAAALSDALNYKGEDEVILRITPRVTAARTPGLDWNRTDNADGSSAYSVKRALPIEWDTKVGADFGLNDSAAPAPGAPSAPLTNNSGSAWANIQVPNIASVDARVSSGSQTRAIGVSRTMPIGSATSLTLQNSYAATEATGSTPPGLAASTPSSVWSNDRAVKLSIAPTGTTFSAGASSSTLDNITHNRLSAEQKFFDKFNVTTTLNDVGTPVQSRSITAGFKTQW